MSQLVWLYIIIMQIGLCTNFHTSDGECPLPVLLAEKEFYSDQNAHFVSSRYMNRIQHGGYIMNKCSFFARNNVLDLSHQCDGKCKYHVEGVPHRMKRSVPVRECPESRIPMACNSNTQYRTMDGRCNNLNNPRWGMSNRIENRFVAPIYDDGISAARVLNSRKDGVLPSARNVSNVIHKGTETLKEQKISLMTMQWGQFLAHDVVLTPTMTNNSAAAKTKKEENMSAAKTPAVVIENGSWTIKAGLAGDDVPRAIFPTLVGSKKDSEQVDLAVGQAAKDDFDNICAHWTFDSNTCSDWSDMATLWKHAYASLKIDPATANVLTTVSMSTPKPEREKMIEIFFEEFKVPGCYVAYDSVLAMYACGRLSGTVVDCGHAGTNVVPIYEGVAIQNNAIRMPFGGKMLTEYLEKLIKNADTPHVDIFKLSKIAESMCRIALNYGDEVKTAAPSKYQLPDGKEIEIKPEALLCPEVYFTPKLRDPNSDIPSLPKGINNQIQKCEMDVRAPLLSNIILAGGASIIPGFHERLTKEMQNLNKTSRVIANSNREAYTFIGGSVLTSLDAMGEHWVTQAEYAEKGPGIVNTKWTDGSELDCCDSTDGSNKTLCFPIFYPFDADEKLRCISLSRSVGDYDCDKVWQQINIQSSYIDASVIYGANERDNSRLRRFINGLMMEVDGKLPPDVDDATCRLDGDFNPIDSYCGRSGDSRANEQPGLAALHTLFLREHNRIVQELLLINPQWRGDDEKLFQEARKIVAAEIQHITYNEFLPAVLSPEKMMEYGLYICPEYRKRNNMRQTPYERCRDNYMYDVNEDATITNVFAAAILRFGHSLVSDSIGKRDINNLRTLVEPFDDHFFVPRLYHMDGRRGLEKILRWISQEKSAQSDHILEEAIRNELFRDMEGEKMDLASLNIQRGRDHGLPGYNAFRKFCALSEANDFDTEHGGLVDHSKDMADRLKTLYNRPDDIDVFVGAMTEKRDTGSLLGPLQQCIMGKMFQKLKDGDRFYFETPMSGIGFTDGESMDVYFFNYLNPCHAEPGIFRFRQEV